MGRRATAKWRSDPEGHARLAYILQKRYNASCNGRSALSVPRPRQSWTPCRRMCARVSSGSYKLVQAVGLERVHEPYIKHIEDRLWEMRLRGRGGIARSLYVRASGRRVVILRTFVKKTQKMPRREIELALKRARGVT